MQDPVTRGVHHAVKVEDCGYAKNLRLRAGKMMIDHWDCTGHREGRPIFDVLWVWQLVCRVQDELSALEVRLLEGSIMETPFC